MVHYKHSTTIVVVRVEGIVGELSACEDQITHLFATLCLLVAKLSIISALGGVVLTARSGMAAPPSFRRSTARICSALSLVMVMFTRFPLVVLALSFV